MSNNSIRYFSTIGAKRVDFCLNKEGRLFGELVFSFYSTPPPRPVLIFFFNEINAAVNDNGR